MIEDKEPYNTYKKISAQDSTAGRQRAGNCTAQSGEVLCVRYQCSNTTVCPGLPWSTRHPIRYPNSTAYRACISGVQQGARSSSACYPISHPPPPPQPGPRYRLHARGLQGSCTRAAGPNCCKTQPLTTGLAQGVPLGIPQDPLPGSASVGPSQPLPAPPAVSRDTLDIVL